MIEDRCVHVFACVSGSLTEKLNLNNSKRSNKGKENEVLCYPKIKSAGLYSL